MRKVAINEQDIHKFSEIIDQCIECKKCMDNCIMLKDFCDTPNFFNKGLKDRTLNIDIPYSCNLCGNCFKECPRAIKLEQIFIDLREEWNKKYILHNPRGYFNVRFHQISSFSSMMKGVSCNNNSHHKIGFMPGCSLSGYSSHIVNKTYEYLNSKLSNVELISYCCGNPTYAMGDVRQFAVYNEELKNVIINNGIEEVITACGSCYKILKEFDLGIKITTLWEALNEIGIDKEIIYRTSKIKITFALNDPCVYRNNSKVHKNVRTLLNKLGIKYEDFKYNQEETLCCGFGGMVGAINPQLALKQMKKRANETKLNYIVNYCETCAEAMKIEGKSSLHILDLMFNEDILKNNFTQKNVKTMNKWIKRRNYVRYIR